MISTRLFGNTAIRIEIDFNLGVLAGGKEHVVFKLQYVEI